MEYNYVDETKKEEVSNPDEKNNKKKKILLYFLFCIPILVGFLLYTTYCSLTPKYVRVQDNSLVSTDEDSVYYTNGDSSKIVNYTIEKSDDSYPILEKNLEKNSNTFFMSVDLTLLKSKNSSFSDLMFYAYISFNFETTLDSIYNYPQISARFEDGTVIKDAYIQTESTLKLKEIKCGTHTSLNMFYVSMPSNSKSEVYSANDYSFTLNSSKIYTYGIQ